MYRYDIGSRGSDATHTTVNFLIFSILVCTLECAIHGVQACGAQAPRVWRTPTGTLAAAPPKRSPHPHRQRRGCLASKSSREGGTTSWSTPFTLAYFTNPGKAKMDFCPLPAGGCCISPNL